MIDKNSALPLVYQIERFICQKIINGEYNVGDIIPSQEKLAELFNVSRITTKNAFSSLIKTGVLESHKGKGTFVKSIPKINNVVDTVTIKRDFFELTASEIIELESNRIYLECRQHLNSEKGHKMVYRKKSGDIPVYVETLWWPDTIDIQNISIHDFCQTNGMQCELYDKIGKIVSYYEETFEPKIANDQVAHLLNLHNAHPLLCIKRKTYVSNDSIPFEYREILIRYEDYGKIIVTHDKNIQLKKE